MGEIPGQTWGGMRVWEGGKRFWPPPPPHMLGRAAPHVLLDGRAPWEGGGARTGQGGKRQAWGRWGSGRRGVMQAWPLGKRLLTAGGVCHGGGCVFAGVPGVCA